MMIKGLMTLIISSYLICILEWLTKTWTTCKSNPESIDQRTLKIMNPVRVQKVY